MFICTGLGQPDKWLDKTDWPSDCKSRREGTRKEKGQVKGKGKGRIETDLGLTGPVTSWIGLDGLDKPLAVRGRSASEPSFLSASRAVKVRVAASSPAPSPSSSSNIRSSYTPPAVKGQFAFSHFPPSFDPFSSAGQARD